MNDHLAPPLVKVEFTYIYHHSNEFDAEMHSILDVSNGITFGADQLLLVGKIWVEKYFFTHRLVTLGKLYLTNE
jgi:hypothetical protein